MDKIIIGMFFKLQKLRAAFPLPYKGVERLRTNYLINGMFYKLQKLRAAFPLPCRGGVRGGVSI